MKFKRQIMLFEQSLNDLIFERDEFEKDSKEYNSIDKRVRYKRGYLDCLYDVVNEIEKLLGDED